MAAQEILPLLALGLPTNAVIALLLWAFMIHGVQPGPLLMKQNPGLFWGGIASMYKGAPLVLAFVLDPMVGVNLRKSLIMSDGSFFIFFSRPLSAVFLILAIGLLVFPLIPRLGKKRDKIAALEERG